MPNSLPKEVCHALNTNNTNNKTSYFKNFTLLKIVLNFTYACVGLNYDLQRDFTRFKTIEIANSDKCPIAKSLNSDIECLIAKSVE